jgi:serine/threonine-protein kinase
MSQRPLTATQTAVRNGPPAGEGQIIRQLGDYKLLSKLGEGGMGAVYLAEDLGAQRKVALKILPLEHADNANCVSRFHREAKAIGKLNHPNIIQAYNIGEEHGYHYYAMEFCDGSPLDSVLAKEHRLPAGRALDITIQAALGLQHAHAHGIIHRDMKPANLFMTSDGVIKILDLGLSKNIENNSQSFVTHAGTVLGTPHYISPEQVLSAKDIDGRTDIYSLGATFYHLVTGRTPFEGKSAAVIISKHLSDQLTNPQDIHPDIPNDVVQVIQRMMAKSPGDRYQSCDELLEDLEAIRDGNALTSTALDPELSSILPRTNILTAIESAVQPKPQPSIGDSEGRPLSLYAGIAAAVVLALTVTVFLVRSGTASVSQTVPEPQMSPPSAAPAAPITPAAAPVASAAPAATTVPIVQSEPTRLAEVTSSAPVQPPIQATTKADPPAPAEPAMSRPVAVAAEEPKAVPVEEPKPAPEAPRDVSADVLKQAAQSLRQSRFTDAIEALDKRTKEAPAESAAIEREKAMIASLRFLRDQALDAIRKMSGKSVTLKIGAADATGIITENPDHTLNWKITNGPEMPLTSAKLEAADVDHFAPKVIDGDNLKARGFLYLVAGDLETAKLYFINAQKNGAGDSVTPYLERIETLQGASKKFTKAAEHRDGGWISLLRRIDPEADTVRGQWAITNNELVAGEGHYGMLEIPYHPPEEYDFRVTFSKTEFNDSVDQIVSHAGKCFAWRMGCMNDTFCIFTRIETGPNPMKNPTLKMKPLTPGQKHVSVVQVRKDGIKAIVDDETIAEWKTDYKDMHTLPEFRLRDESLLGLSNLKGRAVFHDIEVLEVTGRGEFTRAEVDHGKGNQLNLLQRVDPRTAIAGNWKVQNGKLTSDESERARIEIPFAPPAEYDLRLEFSRESGEGGAMVILPWCGRQVVWMLNSSGECHLGMPGAKPNIGSMAVMENGKHRIACFEIRKDQIRVFIDDKFDAPVNTLKADANRGQGDGIMLRDNSHVGIGSNHLSVNFYTAYIREPQAKNQSKPERNEYPNYKR